MSLKYEPASVPQHIYVPSSLDSESSLDSIGVVPLVSPTPETLPRGRAGQPLSSELGTCMAVHTRL